MRLADEDLICQLQGRQEIRRAVDQSLLVSGNADQYAGRQYQ